MKLQNEVDIKNKQLQQQEYDFQQHDMALRDEINSLTKTINQMQSSTPKKSKKIINGDLEHPLSDQNDSGILEMEELEKSLKTEIEKNDILKAEIDQKSKAVKELEVIVRTLRTENENGREL